MHCTYIFHSTCRDSRHISCVCVDGDGTGDSIDVDGTGDIAEAADIGEDVLSCEKLDSEEHLPG